MSSPWFERHHIPATEPPRFSGGDRVTTRMGRGTVIRVESYQMWGSRAYLVRHDFSTCPPEFGKFFCEADLVALIEDEPRLERLAPVQQLSLF